MNTRRAGDRPGITIRAISNHAIESIMDASPALVRGKVRIVDHLFPFISRKKHASPVPACELKRSPDIDTLVVGPCRPDPHPLANVDIGR